MNGDRIDEALKYFPKLRAEIERGFERSLHRGIQIYVSLKGDPVLDAAFGEARPGQPMTTSTLTRWLSSGKPITAVALAMLKEQGSLQWDDPVQKHLPEFANDEISIYHLLTHTSGLPKIELGWPDADWSQIVEKVCSTSPEHPPGTYAAYQPGATWFLLGEIIQRITGRSFADFVRKEICLPLGMHDSWNGMPAEKWTEYGDRISMMWARRRAKLEELHSHGEAHCTSPSPGGNFRGPVNELARFYEKLLDCEMLHFLTRKRQILSDATVKELTDRHRKNLMDHTFQHTMDFGLGFIVGSNHHGVETVPYGFGRYSSPTTFGHGGAESSCAFADRRIGLVVAWAANVRVGEGRHQTRNRAINSAIYEELGLHY